MTSLVSLFAAVFALAPIGACVDDEASPDSPDAGRSAPRDAGTDAAMEADAAVCETGAMGTLIIEVTGLPDDVDAKVTITGSEGAPTDVAASMMLSDAASGMYRVAAERVASVSPIVRAIYEPTVSDESFCLTESPSRTVTVAYAKVASSDTLWTSNANSDSGDLLGFASADLDASGDPAATVDAIARVGRALAFDNEGNLWTIAGTVADAPLSRYASADLGASGKKTADRMLMPELSGCSPGLTALAFEPSGALWVADLCGDRLIRFAADSLGASSAFTLNADDIAMGTIEAPRGIAFDASGNMWVSDATSLHRYPAASLAPGQAHEPTFALNVNTEKGAALPPDALAFDSDGNLWATSFGGNIIYKLTPADLTPAGTSKDVVPSVQIAVTVGALLESLAFDESGGLWLTYSQGKLARLAPTQLGTSTNAGDPTIPETILASANIGYPSAMAFYPTAAGLPLYSRFE
jgi:sugar lactone lactonase YvrE